MNRKKKGYRFQVIGYRKLRAVFTECVRTVTCHLSPVTCHRGFTLLLSVLVSSILLALGFAIYNIVAKDLILSSSGRESQFAFYAADTGIECALYWDGEPDAFSLESEQDNISCGGANVLLASKYDGVNVVETTFSLSLGDGGTGPCAEVFVTKISEPRQTIVESRGYNTCVLTNPRRIERAIRVQY